MSLLMGESDFIWPELPEGAVGPKGYVTPDGIFPRVTTVNRIVGDGVEALIRWAADTERSACMAAAGEAFMLGKAGSPFEFVKEIENSLGAARQHVKKLTEAAEIGSSIHAMIQHRLRTELGEDAGPEPKLKDEAQWAFMAWEDWRKTQRWRPVRIEQPIWDPARKYAGTIDLIAEEDGIDGWIVPDWKSSKGIYSTHHLQLGAYCDALEKWTGREVARAFIVKTPKTIGDELISVRDLGDTAYDYTKNGRRYMGGRKLTRQQLTACFDAALTLHRFLVSK